MTTPLTHARVHALLDAYGGDPARWPEAERAAGLAALAQDPALRALADEARALDGWLDALPAPAPPTPAVVAAVREAARAPRGLRALLAEFAGGLFGGWRVAGPALAMSLVLGIALGSTLLPAEDAGLLELAHLDDAYSEY